MNNINISEIDISVRDINLLAVNAFIKKKYEHALKYTKNVIKNINNENLILNKIQYYFNYAYINKILKYEYTTYLILIKNLKSVNSFLNTFLFDTIFNKPILLKDLLLINNFLIGESYFNNKNYKFALKYLETYTTNREIFEKYYPKSKAIILDYYEHISDNDNFIRECIITKNTSRLLKYIENISDVIKKNNFIKNIFEYITYEEYDSHYINMFIVNKLTNIFYIINILIEFNDPHKLKNIILKHIELYNDNIKILLYYYLVKYTYSYDNEKYCKLVIDLYENINDQEEKNRLKNIFNFVVDIYNTSYFNIRDIKYRKYLTKDNINYINYKLYDYYKLKSIFKNNELFENCIICENENFMLSLGCHESHKVCYECFEKIDNCPFCRNSI